MVNAAPGLFFAIGGLATLATSILKGVKVNLRPGATGAPETNQPRGAHPTFCPDNEKPAHGCAGVGYFTPLLRAQRVRRDAAR